MTTLYVAGPMTGMKDHNYPAFNAAADHLRALGYDVLNPVDAEQHNDTGQPQPWDWYMRHAIRMVTHSDAIAVLPLWQRSKGAQLEVQIARALGMRVAPVAMWGRQDAEATA